MTQGPFGRVSNRIHTSAWGTESLLRLNADKQTLLRVARTYTNGTWFPYKWICVNSICKRIKLYHVCPEKNQNSVLATVAENSENCRKWCRPWGLGNSQTISGRNCPFRQDIAFGKYQVNIRWGFGRYQGFWLNVPFVKICPDMRYPGMKKKINHVIES